MFTCFIAQEPLALEFGAKSQGLGGKARKELLEEFALKYRDRAPVSTLSALVHSFAHALMHSCAHARRTPTAR